MLKKEPPIRGIIKSLGLVFGDIGTSPIYTLTVVFLLLKPTESNIMGVLSLVFWTIIILVSIEYSWLAMSLGKRGEGGTIVLREIILPLLKSSRAASFIGILSFLGISLLIGDGVITPAISILSAVEGLTLVPGLEFLKTNALIAIASCIAIVLFAVQKHGTEKVATFFGPLMLMWFVCLSISGFVSLTDHPAVAFSVNPYYAVNFFRENGLTGFFILSEVILCATGGEALYADMGHLGRKPILRAWYFVSVALIINYLGQGSYLLSHPNTKNILFEMIMFQTPALYIPFLILSIAATVIASQAMISGIFSIVYQGIMTNIIPAFKVHYTSEELRSQIYIGTVNWFLLVAVLFIMIEFQRSSNLAAAYGLAVTGTMAITGIMITWIFYLMKNYLKTAIAAFVTLVDLAFLFSNTYKIPHGGYWSIVISMLPLCLIFLYTIGQRKLHQCTEPMERDEFLEKYNHSYNNKSKIKGTALFFTRYADRVNPYILQTMFVNEIIYEDNIIINVVVRVDPFGATGFFTAYLADGLSVFEIQLGYMEVVDVEEILRENSIDEKTIFYGIEDIITENPLWQIFSIIKKLSPRFVQFIKLPSHKLHGVVTRIEM
ncbi:MAG: KUP/HAK/KT family potassium transporter [Nitrospirae bacterium YQR-1]